MRKYLLASAAAAGTLLYAGFASAQLVTSPTLVNGQAQAMGSDTFPTPGTVTVRLGGLVDWFAAAASDSTDRTTALIESDGKLVKNPAFKQAAYSFGDYIRLYPTVDGVAANGLRYGAYSEFRVEQFYGTGGGANGSVSGIDRSSTLYVRRAFLYIGLPTAGTVRLGTGDGAGGLFDTGTFQNFDGGAWNGDVENLVASNATPSFPFAGGVGAFYATNKATYLSPQIAGFELGVSYEPNTSNVTDYDSSGNAATLGTGGGAAAVRADSSSVAGDLKRRRNVFNPEVRYRQVFGPVGVAAEGGYYVSGVTSYDGVPTSTTIQYKGWNFYDGGLVLTFGGLSVGGHVMAGAFNGQGALEPQGQRNAFAYIGGASYTIGPVIAGASFFQYNLPGNSGTSLTAQGKLVGQERDRGIAAGGTYTIVPGLSVFLSYVYGDRKESGYDLLNGAVDVAGSNQGNATRAQVLALGTNVRW